MIAIVAKFIKNYRLDLDSYSNRKYKCNDSGENNSKTADQYGKGNNEKR